MEDNDKRARTEMYWKAITGDFWVFTLTNKY